jgi:ATP-dependent Clp protease ATP-binding subunit ClpC
MPHDHRYSHHARRAIGHAGELAAQYRHPRVDTGHLLVGILRAEGSIGAAVLRELGLEAERAASQLRALIVPHPTAATAHPTHDAALDAALDLAADEAVWLGHHYIGTEHLLLGMTRTHVGNVADLLRQLDIAPDLLRRRVRRALHDGFTELMLEQARRAARLSELARRVLTAAEQRAGDAAATSWHLLLALLAEGRGAVPALLRESGLAMADLERQLKRRAPLSTDLDDILYHASELAETYDSHYVGTEHLLLALLLNPALSAPFAESGIDIQALIARVEAQLRA